MCQLCADDRTVEPHPPLHLWNGGVPTYLHVHQQRLEGRGEHKDIYEWNLQQKSLSSRPGKRCPVKYFRTTNWDTDLFMISTALPCDVLAIYLYAYSPSAGLPVQAGPWVRGFREGKMFL